MTPEKYMENKARMAFELSHKLENNLDDYLQKAGEGYPQDVQAMAKCALGKRLSKCRGSCFALPPDLMEV